MFIALCVASAPRLDTNGMGKFNGEATLAVWPWSKGCASLEIHSNA